MPVCRPCVAALPDIPPNCVAHFSSCITQTPTKHVCEHMCVYACMRRVLMRLAPLRRLLQILMPSTPLGLIFEGTDAEVRLYNVPRLKALAAAALQVGGGKDGGAG